MINFLLSKSSWTSYQTAIVPRMLKVRFVLMLGPPVTIVDRLKSIATEALHRNTNPPLVENLMLELSPLY